MIDTSRIEDAKSNAQACQNCAQLKAQLIQLNTIILQMDGPHDQLLKSIEVSNKRHMSLRSKLHKQDV